MKKKKGKESNKKSLVGVEKNNVLKCQKDEQDNEPWRKRKGKKATKKRDKWKKSNEQRKEWRERKRRKIKKTKLKRKKN